MIWENIIAFAGACLIVRMALHQDSNYTGKGGLGIYNLKGDSMLPALHGGSVIIDYSFPMQYLEKGDIIVYTYNGEDYCHRVIDIQGRFLGGITVLTKGDNEDSPDPVLVTKSNYVGKIRI